MGRLKETSCNPDRGVGDVRLRDNGQQERRVGGPKTRVGTGRMSFVTGRREWSFSKKGRVNECSSTTKGEKVKNRGREWSSDCKNDQPVVVGWA